MYAHVKCNLSWKVTYCDLTQSRCPEQWVGQAINASRYFGTWYYQSSDV